MWYIRIISYDNKAYTDKLILRLFYYDRLSFLKVFKQYNLNLQQPVLDCQYDCNWNMTFNL